MNVCLLSLLTISHNMKGTSIVQRKSIQKGAHMKMSKNSCRKERNGTNNSIKFIKEMSFFRKPHTPCVKLCERRNTKDWA